MTRLAMLKDVVNDTNAERLFDQAAGLSKDQLKRLVAELLAKPVHEKKRQHTFRKVPVPKPVVLSEEARELRDGEDTPAPPADFGESDEPNAASTDRVETGGRIETSEQDETVQQPEIAEPENTEESTLFVVAPSKRSDFRPIAGDRYDVSMRVSARFVELLRELTVAESHAVPDGNPETILIRAMELRLEHAGKKTGKVPVQARAKPANQPAPDPSSAYITADLRRAVFVRDGHSCTWPRASGERCGSTHCLEPDHIVPRGKGGRTELSNLRLLCRAHNQQAAREAFGSKHIDACIRGRKPDD